MKKHKIWVIGDIHSGFKALEALISRIGPHKKDQLIFLGDYVDGWSQAVETVDYLMELQSLHDCVFLRGNHDELCYEWLKGKKDNPMWHKHGGSATMASYKGVGRNTKKRHMEFYKTLLNYYLDGQRRLFLHAGFTNLKGVEHEYFGKTFYWDRTLWELALAVDPKLKADNPLYPQRLKNYKEIFIGHTPVTRMGHTTPQQAASVWNIDTGAAFKGPLTALDVQTKAYIQTDPVYTFYPHEVGRN